MESNQLAVYQNFDNISKAAQALQKSGYFKDVTSEAQAIVKVMAGAELGLPPFASIAGIHFINGKPALGSNVVATLVKNDPRYDYRIDECNNKICAINWFEDGKLVGVSTFTMEEANAAGITGKPTWKAYPSDMLFARAITRGARRFAPGIFGGSPIYTPEELGAEVDEEGYIDTTHRITVEKPEIKIFVDEPESMVDAAVELGGHVKDEQPKQYNGKVVHIHLHDYPQAWSKVVSTFVPKKIENTPHLDGILQKLALSFDTPVDDVIASVNDYLKEK